MKIRNAGSNDFSFVRFLYEEFDGKAAGFSEDDYLRFIGNDNQHLAIAFDDEDNAVGVVSWTVWRGALSYPRSICFIQDVVVAKERRREGVGSILLGHVKEWAMSNDIKILHLQTDKDDNEGRLKFYRQNEFKALNFGMYYYC